MGKFFRRRAVLFAPAAVIYLGVIFILEQNAVERVINTNCSRCGRRCTLCGARALHPSKLQNRAALTETAADLHRWWMSTWICSSAWIMKRNWKLTPWRGKDYLSSRYLQKLGDKWGYANLIV
jgi:hypothetical protein